MKTWKQSLAIMAAATAAATVPMASFAADGEITFNGSIWPQTCTINGNGQGSANFSVTLPTVLESSLATEGAVAGRTPFTIALTNCSPDSGSISTYFEPGVTVNTQTGQLINATGSATNVEIGLLNSDTTKINLGQAQPTQNSLSTTIQSGSAALNYHAQYVAVGGAAQAGDVQTSVMYSLTYP